MMDKQQMNSIKNFLYMLATQEHPLLVSWESTDGYYDLEGGDARDMASRLLKDISAAAPDDDSEA